MGVRTPFWPLGGRIEYSFQEDTGSFSADHFMSFYVEHLWCFINSGLRYTQLFDGHWYDAALVMIEI